MIPLPWPPNTRSSPGVAGRALVFWWLVASSIGLGCANDMDPGIGGGDGGRDSDLVADAAGDGLGDGPDAGVAIDLGLGPMEPPLTVPACPVDGGPGATCCASALGFEDGSTSHFLTPACCKMALSKPQIASMPTACGRGALRVDADFRATDASANCGETGEAPACAFRDGEISRAVWGPLDLTGLTASAMVYLDGPALPAAPVHANLFVLGRAGVIEGTATPLAATGVWTRVDLQIADDGMAPGADIRVIGLRMAFHGQAWLGRVYIDEITWR